MQLIAQEDGEIMVPSPHHAKLQKSCLTTSLSVAAALYFGQFDCATLSLLVLLASVVYWKNPRKGLRRNVDMTLAFGGLLYQMLAHAPKLLLASQPRWAAFMLYASGMGAGSLSYALARHHGHKADYSRATNWHASLHLWGNVGNLFLYWGLSRLTEMHEARHQAVAANLTALAAF